MSFDRNYFMAEFERVRRKVDGLNGVGVVNDPGSISINPPPPEPGTAPGDPFSAAYAKLTSTWSSNTANVVIGNPSDNTGGNIGSASLRLNLVSPTSASPTTCDLVTGNVVQYMPYSPPIGTGTNKLDGLVVAYLQSGTNNLGTRIYQVYQMTSSASGTVSGTAGWDYVRCHNVP